jgi:hypothetical protein
MPSIKTWTKHQQQKTALISLAKGYKEADRKLEEVSGSNAAWEYTIRGYKAPGANNTPEGLASGQAFGNLVAYHKHLVRDLGLDHYMVRKVWTEIFSAEGAERQRTGILNPGEL